MFDKVSITIDVVSKLKKIYEGKTFSDSLVVITELFQNSQRAKAENVHVCVGENRISFKDDGCGCKDPKDIFTLDHSSWESTDEGFGIGLWSWLAVSDVEAIEIKSHNWKASLTVNQIFNDNNLNAVIEELPDKIKGFEVVIFSNAFDGIMSTVKDRVLSDGEMQLFNVFLNNELIPKKDLHGDVDGKFKMSFSTRYFNATLVPETWGIVKTYYERRLVDNFYPLDHISGVLEVKPNALTLQEPDRKNVIRDIKRELFIERLKECRKELFIDIVKRADAKCIDEYSYAIDMVLDVGDYEKYLLVDDLILEVEEEKRNIGNLNSIGKANSFKRLVETIESLNQSTQLSLTENRTEDGQQELVEELLNSNSDSHRWVKTNMYDYEAEANLSCEPFTKEFLDTLNLVSIGGVVYKKIDISDHRDMFEEEDEDIASTITVKATKKSKNKDSLRSVLSKTSRKVWVKASEIEEYADLIAKVEYYGVKVFIARNILHENVFKANNVSYITDIESGIQKRNIKWNVELKTKKEERFIELLQPICKYYNLPLNTFKIGNLKLIIETTLDNKVINREVVENTKDTIGLYGVTDGASIILDRRAIGLQRFNLSGNYLGINEFKALMASMKTIAHELAHLLYKTEDNTKEHREREDKIYEELVNLYLAL